VLALILSGVHGLGEVRDGRGGGHEVWREKVIDACILERCNGKCCSEVQDLMAWAETQRRFWVLAGVEMAACVSI